MELTAKVHCVSSHQPCLGVKRKQSPFEAHAARPRWMQPLLLAALAVNINSVQLQMCALERLVQN